jgi:hypothetical protein
MYAERAKEDSHLRRQEDEAHWQRTRSLWEPFMNVHYKKPGGGKWTLQDLIKLSTDKDEPVQVQEKPTLETFDQLTAKHGIKRQRKKKKDGK